ncbi:MAG: mandelate racemase/muconate lactonizing enzyme family protein [Armatimonadaceae bacterium]
MIITQFYTRLLQELFPEDPLDPSTQTVVVCLEDAAGNIGIGETDASPVAVQAYLNMPTAHDWSRSFESILLGEDAVEIGTLWERMYQGTVWTGRRGLGIHALSAVDIALHDLAARRLGIPVYKLLGGRRRDFLTPYATVYAGAPEGRTHSEVLDTLLERMAKAVALGFHAVKMEVLLGNLATDPQVAEMIREGRAVLGDDVAMLVDFGYRFGHWRDAARLLNRVEDCNLYLAEATLSHDDLAGHARLTDAVAVRIGGAEMAATRFECREWIERGRVDVLQPDINRCGGLTEMRRIAQMAEDYGVEVIPHAWKSGITVAACCHFQASTPNVPFFEFLSPELWVSPLRAELTAPEPVLRPDGTMTLPDLPGLGVCLREEALHRFSRTRPDSPPAPPRNGADPTPAETTFILADRS